MNYDHTNKIHAYYRKKLYPYFTHQFSATSFDDYLKKFSFIPSGKWLQDFEIVKLNRVAFAIDPEKLVKKYKDVCVTYNAPMKAEDGIQRVVYQVSPTLHFEAAFWIWVENELTQSYATAFVCYHNESEFTKFLDDLFKIRREGNTEDKKMPTGFHSIGKWDEEEDLK